MLGERDQKASGDRAEAPEASASNQRREDMISRRRTHQLSTQPSLSAALRRLDAASMAIRPFCAAIKECVMKMCLDRTREMRENTAWE